MTTEAKALDQLLDEAQRLTETGYVHGDIKIDKYGWSLIVRDAEPVDTDEGTVYPGAIVTAGFGQNLDEAVAAANRSMKSRASLPA
ncbi:hypothetical protein PBI_CLOVERMINNIE_50 [Gordonia phage CloverMinnie]|nr:hypothetical protein PBI_CLOVERMINNIE_50 [Gordonia phage CloverMinnie]UBF41653.1 hypothetical protein SEA_ANARQUE_50 [Gordonia phage AnarQue]WNM74943.1 hypothetical protein SEA_MOSSROSE_50 [Gordonia phage MossRose]